ncbi:MAG: rod shape-determining protein RodA [Bacteroidota bacterium]|nr:rod shape-determining protein RodA [Bacteroidota bacterium]
MRKRINILKQLDWFTIAVFLLLAAMGWMSIFSSSWEGVGDRMFEPGSRQMKQAVWVGLSFVMIILVFLIDSKFFSAFAYVLYAVVMLSLIAVLVFGTEVNGARSWFELGNFRFQPAEFAKIFTSLALAQLLTSFQFNLKKTKHLLRAFAIIMIPVAMIILQNDTGSALVFFALVIVLYREGMKSTYLFIALAAVLLFVLSVLISSGWVLAGAAFVLLALYWLNERDNKGFFVALTISVGVTVMMILLKQRDIINLSFVWIITISIFVTLLSLLPGMLRARSNTALGLSAILLVTFVYINTLDHVYYNVLQSHQRDRIEHTLGLKDDPLGIGYNVNQSKIAIGSGGFSGKGFLQGTQTKFDFVPEQSTDFIFCTVGEEFGFIGAGLVVLLFASLLIRLIILTERQRSKFSRVYGYAVVSILFFHVTINIGMTIGLMPVIGIPLPFFSYGGSSFMAFTLFLFIFLRLDANRLEIFR